MRSVAHWLQWAAAAAKDLILRPTYRPREFWDRKHAKGDSFAAVGCRRYDESGNARWYARMEEDFLSELKRHDLDLSQLSVLEVGVGTGYWTEVVRRAGCRQYLGIDIADAAVQRLRSKFPSYEFLTSDVSQMQIPGKWDVIVMIHVAEHLVDDMFERTMRPIKGCMKPASHFLVTASPRGKRSHVPHVQYRSEDDFTRIFPPDWVERPTAPCAEDWLLSISESHSGRA